jgi:hypothetical protein
MIAVCDNVDLVVIHVLGISADSTGDPSPPRWYELSMFTNCIASSAPQDDGCFRLLTSITPLSHYPHPSQSAKSPDHPDITDPPFQAENF